MSESLAKHAAKKKETCEKCKGAGLIKETQKNICIHCYDSKFPNKYSICCYCENTKHKNGCYNECNVCSGSGETH